MQLCFDVAVDVMRDENHIKFATFLKASRYDRQKATPSVNWALDKDTQNIVNGITGVTNINSSVVLYIEATMNAMEGPCAIYLTFEQKHPQ